MKNMNEIGDTVPVDTSDTLPTEPPEDGQGAPPPPRTIEDDFTDVRFVLNGYPRNVVADEAFERIRVRHLATVERLTLTRNGLRRLLGTVASLLGEDGEGITADDAQGVLDQCDYPVRIVGLPPGVTMAQAQAVLDAHNCRACGGPGRGPDNVLPCSNCGSRLP